MKATPSKKSAVILDGKEIANKIKAEISKSISEGMARPGLAAVLIGDDPASEIYIKLKEKSAEEVGIQFHKYLCNQKCCNDLTEDELLGMIEFLNRDSDIHAIILQLPLPSGYDTQKIINSIDPNKDVDGFHPKNKSVIPPTVDAVIELLKAASVMARSQQTTKQSRGPESEDFFKNKKTLIIGKSQVFINGIEDHLKAELKINSIESNDSIPENSDQYDIIVIALGKAHTLKKSDVKEGAIVIDVGINKLGDKTVGDVDPSVADVAGYLSPVPGGVGPLTVACLLRNAYLLSLKK